MPPALLWVPACVVAVAMALPLAYLVVRTLGAGEETWDLLFRSRTLDTLGRTCLLVFTVTTGSVLLALPLAWLTERTDLPFRRAWEVITILPLVIPSYIGGFLVVVTLGPKGMLQDLLETLFGIERLPDIYGLPGATLTLVLFSFPYVLLPLRAALRRMDPGLEDTARSLGFGGGTIFFKVTLPLLRPALLSGALLVALYTLSDFGAVSLLDYETFTRAIFIQYESAFNRDLAAGLCLALLVLAMLVLLAESLARGSTRYYRSSGRSVGPFDTASPREVAVASLRLLHIHRNHIVAHSFGCALVLAGARYRLWRGTVGPVECWLAVVLRICIGYGCLGIGCAAHIFPVGAPPRGGHQAAGKSILCRVRPARDCGGPRIGVLWGKLRHAHLPDRAPVGTGIHGAVSPCLGGSNPHIHAADQPKGRGGSPESGGSLPAQAV